MRLACLLLLPWLLQAQNVFTCKVQASIGGVDYERTNTNGSCSLPLDAPSEAWVHYNPPIDYTYMRLYTPRGSSSYAELSYSQGETLTAVVTGAVGSGTLRIRMIWRTEFNSDATVFYSSKALVSNPDPTFTHDGSILQSTKELVDGYSGGDITRTYIFTFDVPVVFGTPVSYRWSHVFRVSQTCPDCAQFREYGVNRLLMTSTWPPRFLSSSSTPPPFAVFDANGNPVPGAEVSLVEPTTIATSPPGLSFITNGASYVAPKTFHWIPRTSQSVTVPSPQISGASKFTFTAWSPYNPGGMYPLGPPITLTANFATAHLLSTLESPKAGGTIAFSPLSDDGYYPTGTSVQVAATPASGYAFAGFAGDLSGITSPQTLTMSSPRSVTANFACLYSLGAPALSVPSAASGGSFNFTTGAGCAWNRTTATPWITLNPPASGVGSSAVTFSVSPNPGPTARTGTITIVGQTFAVNQAALSCTFTLSANSINMPNSGASGSVSVITNGSACPWTAASTEAWTIITAGANSIGGGTVVFTLQPNPNAFTRSATLSVAGQSFTITQASATCTFAVDPTTVDAPAFGTSGVLLVQAPQGCPWTATSPVSWFIFSSPASGNGNGSVTYQVQPNPTPNSRSATMTLGAVAVLANQTGTQTGQQITGLRFVPLDPCRVMETRSEYNFQNRTGAFGPPFVGGAETRTLNLAQSTICQIPSTAKAYVLNVTVIPRGGVDFITIYPVGEVRPTFWTVRSPDGQIVANTAIVKAGTNGGISVYASDNTDMIIDISGYFTDDANTPSYTYYPLTPCRVLDTRVVYRPQTGPFGPPTMNAGERRSFALPSATQYCQIPQGAKAYAITLTVVPAGPLQFLTAWPTGGAQPNVSSINSPAGRTLANSVIVPANALGSIDAFVFDRSDVLMDITGYFGPEDGTTGLLYFPVTQCRAHDSQFADEQTKTISMGSCAGVPASAKGYAANVTSISGGSPVPFLTLYPTGQGRPNASTLNAFEGQTITNSTIVPSGADASIDVFAYRRTRVVVEVSGYFGR